MKYIQKSVLACSFALVSIAVPSAFAQTSSAESQVNNGIEEILVTGRKREESLVDVPVSISVLSASMIQEQGIISQQDLFDATPGLSFDTATGDRNSSQPAVRGVQSNEIATTQQKVNSFIDGLPLLGQVGSLTFSGIEQVEVYRGPQSAAFGRSTFAGAINYVTADAAEEFEGKVSVRASDLGGNEIGISLSGPINDNLGYRLSYVADEFTGPDEWTATDGTEMGTQETGTLSAKLNFEFSDSVYGEVMYSRVDQEDGAAAQWRLDPSNCNFSSGNFLFNMGARIELPADEWDCDINSDPLAANHDLLGQFIGQYDAANYGGLTIDDYLAQTNGDGETYEQILLKDSVIPFAITERDRYQGELNFEIGDSLLTVLGMYSTEFYQRWNDSDGSDTHAEISAMGISMNVGSMSDPTDIEEKYVEARWASPSDARARYTLSGSYYTYDFLTNVYFDYGAIGFNLVNETTGEALDPSRNLIVSNSTENFGASFGLQYDLTDKTTFSFEGRYQSDENCGSDVVNSLEDCVTTKSFSPRIAINTTLSDNASVYAQISRGTNPAGINITYSNPLFVEALQIASGQIAVPGTDPDGLTPVNAGIIYDGSDGIHFPAVSYDASVYESYEEEVLTNYEIGAKGTFAGNKGTFAAALYYMDWSDLVSARNLDWGDESDPDGAFVGGWNIDGGWEDYDGTRTFLNSGDAEFLGLEFVATYALSDVWGIGGNITISESTYTDYCSVTGTDYSSSAAAPFPDIFTILTPETDGVAADCAVADGNNIPRTSEVSGAFDVTASLPNEILGMRTSFRADVRYTGPHYIDDFELIERSAVTTINVSANMRNDDGLSLRLFVNNLADEDEPANLAFGNVYQEPAPGEFNPASAAGWTVTPRRPREVGLTLGYEF